VEPQDEFLPRPLRTGNLFEAQYVVASVVSRDEYQVGGEPLAPGDVVVDIGAHIGSFSYLCHRLGSRAIHAYEPDERNFRLLEANVGDLAGVHLSRMAVWRSDGEDPDDLLRQSGPDGMNTGANTVMGAGHAVDFGQQSIAGTAACDRSTGSIPLDRILERFAGVRILKLDCEGSEFPILLTSRMLGRVGRIVAEVHEFGAAMMDGLDRRGRVDGYAEYRLAGLVDWLAWFGFVAGTRPNGSHMYLLDARRS
jgi:FkbM family methyltransferase